MNGKQIVTTLAIALVFCSSANAAEYYVSPAGNDNSAGTRDAPWRTIDKANRDLRPGDTVFLRSGEYTEAIRPDRSGIEGSPIQYKAYPGESAVITDPPRDDSGRRTAIVLNNRSFIVIDGVRVDGKRLSGGGKDSNIDSFIRMSNGDFNIIRNSDFQFANGNTGVYISGGSDYNRFVNNSFDAVGTNHIPDGYDNADNDRGDIMAIRNGIGNVVQGNSFSRGGHSTLDVVGSFNVIRGNTFSGRWTGTDSPGSRAGGTLSGNIKYDAPDPRGFNLFELNVVRDSDGSVDNPENPGMKVEGTSQIVRGNFFFDNSGAAISGATRLGSVESTRHNRIYQNTFFNNKSMVVYRDYNNELPLNDNVWKNNLVVSHQSSTIAALMISTSASINPATTNDLNQTVLAGNLFSPSSGNTVKIKAEFGDTASTESLEWFEQNYSQNVFRNRVSIIQFQNASARTPTGFEVLAGSPAVDSAIELTRTTSSGSGTVVRVFDARYFFDGFGIPGESGDLIVIGNQQPVRIIAIDYQRNELRLSSPFQWSANAPVSLQYDGHGADVGAHELFRLRDTLAPASAVSSDSARPLPPTGIVIGN